MKFYEAMELLQNGHKVRPVKWTDKSDYICSKEQDAITCLSAFMNVHEEWEIFEEEQDVTNLSSQIENLSKNLNFQVEKLCELLKEMKDNIKS